MVSIILNHLLINAQIFAKNTKHQEELVYHFNYRSYLAQFLACVSFQCWIVIKTMVLLQLKLLVPTVQVHFQTKNM
jgi:hypothetical protein